MAYIGVKHVRYIVEMHQPGKFNEGVPTLQMSRIHVLQAVSNRKNAYATETANNELLTI